MWTNIICIHTNLFSAWYLKYIKSSLYNTSWNMQLLQKPALTRKAKMTRWCGQIRRHLVRNLVRNFMLNEATDFTYFISKNKKIRKHDCRLVLSSTFPILLKAVNCPLDQHGTTLKDFDVNSSSWHVIFLYINVTKTSAKVWFLNLM